MHLLLLFNHKPDSTQGNAAGSPRKKPRRLYRILEEDFAPRIEEPKPEPRKKAVKVQKRAVAVAIAEEKLDTETDDRRRRKLAAILKAADESAKRFDALVARDALLRAEIARILAEEKQDEDDALSLLLGVPVMRDVEIISDDEDEALMLLITA